MPPQQKPNPYEFITNPQQASNGKFAGPGSYDSGEKKKRIFVVVIGAIVLIVVVVTFMSILSSSGKGLTNALTGVAQDQSELNHLASQTVDQATQQVTKNVGITVTLTMTSAQTDFTALIAKSGIKLSKQVLAAKQSGTIDTQLKNASSASNFDTVFLGVMKTKLQVYQQDLATAAAAHPTKKQLVLLTADYNDSKLLANQVDQATASLTP